MKIKNLYKSIACVFCNAIYIMHTSRNKSNISNVLQIMKVNFNSWIYVIFDINDS